MNTQAVNTLAALSVVSFISALAVKLMPNLWFVIPLMFIIGLLYSAYKLWKSL